MIHASVLPYLRNPRLAALATSREPAWVWSIDGTRVLWANAVAVKMLDAGNLTLLRERRFEVTDRAAAHVARLAGSLPENGSARLERLRGFGTGFFRLLTCTCSRLTLSDGTSAILIASNEPAGADMSLADCARCLFEGSEEAIAAFGTDGTLLYATPAASQRMADANTLIAFEANALAAEALANGSSAGRTLVGPTILLRLGLPGTIALMASFAAHEAVPAANVSAPPIAPTEPAADTAPVTPPTLSAPAVTPPRQHPLRFVWQFDVDGRFTITSDEFLDLAGPSTARVAGKSWTDINAALQLDTDDRVARAVNTRDTWSGIVLSWPVDGVSERLKVELSGLPIYDRERNFIGYRGFGVCRDVEALIAIATQRRDAPASADPALIAGAQPAAPEQTSVAAAEPVPQPPLARPAPNVVPFRIAAAADSKPSPGLDAGERNTFTEIARQLSARLKNNERPSGAPHDGAAAALRSTPAPGIDGRALAMDAETSAATANPADRDEAPKHEAPDAKTAAASDGAAEAQPAEAGAWLAQGSDARALFDRLPLGVLVYRFDAMLYANRTFLTCVGYDSLQSFADAGGIDSLFIEASDAPGDSGAQSLTITTGHGDAVPVEGKLFSVPWNGENALALVLTGPKAKGEESPQQQPQLPAPAHDDSELRSRLQSLESELAAAKRLAETASADRSDLLGRIGTEVRTPLAAIISFAEAMLNERSGPIGNERYRAYLTDIHYSGSRILALFDELASLSKIDHAKTEPSIPSINLNEIVQSCVAQMQVEASRARVLIRTSPGNGLPDVAAEQDSIRKVVLNLLANSIRFAGAGGQVIVSTTRDSQGQVLLRLRDTGPGLNENDLAQLRSPAKPSSSTNATDQQLSLAVARALLEANQATLSVTSKSDEGTLVEVAFAAAR